jgi:hypothetical protein
MLRICCLVPSCHMLIESELCELSQRCKAQRAGACRGGGDGDAIRMTILDLLRNNGIKEGHRPGIECRFLAQWHQKLHSNTTKDDIAIAEAYLHFLHGSGDWGDFWWFLFEHYGLTQDDLAAMKVGWRNDAVCFKNSHLSIAFGDGKMIWRSAHAHGKA